MKYFVGKQTILELHFKKYLMKFENNENYVKINNTNIIIHTILSLFIQLCSIDMFIKSKYLILKFQAFQITDSKFIMKVQVASISRVMEIYLFNFHEDLSQRWARWIW